MSEKSKKKPATKKKEPKQAPVEEQSVVDAEMVESQAIEAEQSTSDLLDKPVKPKKKKNTAVVKKELSEEDIAKIKKLEELKKRIHRMTDNFIQVVIDLKTIQEEHLWEKVLDKDGNQIYHNFYTFMDAEFGFKKAYYSRLNDASDAYHWLEVKDNELLAQVKTFRPAFYEAFGKLPEGDRIETLRTLIEDKKQKQKGTSLIRIWKKAHEGQTLSGEPKEPDVKKQIEIALGILSRISPDKLKENDVLLDSLVKDNKELKEVIEYINGRIAKSK